METPAAPDVTVSSLDDDGRAHPLRTDSPEWVCPKHSVALAEAAGLLSCPAGCAYPIVDGIANFVAHSAYASAFGLQWLRYRRTQLDTYTGLPISESRLRRCLGEANWKLLPESNVLEAGCGAGRFTEILLRNSAHVTSVDLSEAVVANAANFPPNEKHRVAQADILSLPLKRRSFDIVLCLGVLQHTPSPEQTIKSLYDHLRPGGWLVVDHYKHGLGRMTRLAPLFRQVLKRLPAEKGLRCTESLVRTFFPLHKATRNSYVAHLLLTRVSPLIVFFHSIPELGDELQYEWSLLDTHDSLTDWYKHFRTRSQMIHAAESLGAAEIHCVYAGNGVELRARRPA